MKRLIWLVPLVLIFLNSCVTNKKYIYLQKDDVNRSDMPKDSLLREYGIEHFDYKIQSNDLLLVRFNSVSPEEYNFFSKQTQNLNLGNQSAGLLIIGELVDPEGQIPFPVVGKVKVAGLNIFEAQDKIQKIAEQYLEAPIVKVRLLNFRVTFLGEVASEGTITLSNNRVTMIEAIAQAGGLGELADRTSIKLIRQQGDSTSVQYINLLDEDFMTSPYFYVHQNDIVIVPPLRQRPVRKYLATNIGLIVSSISLVLLILNFTK